MEKHNAARQAIFDESAPKESCKSCLFFNPCDLKNKSDVAVSILSQFGQCRRRAPSISGSSKIMLPAMVINHETGKASAESWHNMNFAGFPDIGEDGWCGEWEKKP